LFESGDLFWLLFFGRRPFVLEKEAASSSSAVSDQRINRSDIDSTSGAIVFTNKKRKRKEKW